MKRHWTLLGALALLLSVGSGPTLAADACADDYLGSKPPRIVVKVKGDQYRLCYLEFAVVYSAETRTPLWSAEHLTAKQLKKPVPRNQTYHSEAALPADVQTKQADFSKPEFDIGHMTPANDASSEESEWQTFSLANMVPQHRRLNRGVWASIEKATRRLALKHGELFVVTGPIFAKTPARTKRGVGVPQQTFKAIYDPAAGQASAYVADNDKDRVVRLRSIKSLTGLVGYDVFPGLKASAKSKVVDLLGLSVQK